MAKLKALNRQKARQRKIWNSDVNPGPTPQTVRKCRQDNMLALYKKGEIDKDMLKAAEHIRHMFDAISKGFGSRAIDHSEPYHDKPTRLPRMGIETLTREDFAHWCGVYRPWSSEETQIKVAGMRRSELVHLLVVENISPHSVENAHRFRHGTALEHLKDSLQLYCVCAGWA